MAIKQKDIRRNLGLWNYVKLSGRIGLSMPKKAYNSIKSNYIDGKERLSDYVKEEAVEYKKNIEQSLNEELKDLSTMKKEVTKDKTLSKTNKAIYIDEINKKIEKLKSKKVTVRNRGLGIFTLAKLSIAKYRDLRKIEKIAKAEEKERMHEQKEILEGMERYEAMMREAEALRAENAAKIEAHENKFNVSILNQAQEYQTKVVSEPMISTPEPTMKTPEPVISTPVTPTPVTTSEEPVIEPTPVAPVAPVVESTPELEPVTPELIPLIYSRKPTMKERWIKVLTVAMIAAMLVNAHLNAKSKIVDRLEKKFNYSPPEMSQVVDFVRPEVSVDDEVNVPTDEIVDEKTSSTYWDKEEFKLGDIVLLDTTTPIYNNAIDAVMKTNGVEHLFKDKDERIIEAVTYKFIENNTPKFITVFATEQDSEAKVQALKDQGATLEGVLITKTQYSGKNLGNEGFKNIYDVQLAAREKGVSR